MKTGRFASTLVVLLLAGGVLVWSGCGTAPEREATAPPKDSGEAVDQARPSSEEDASVDAKIATPAPPSDEVWIEPPAAAPEPQGGDTGYRWTESSGPQAPMAMPLDEPIGQPYEQPEASPPALDNPIRQPGARPPLAVSSVNPIRPPVGALRMAPPALAAREPTPASPPSEAASAYPMAEPPSSLERSIASARAEPLPAAPDEPLGGQLLPLMAPPSERSAAAPEGIDDLLPDKAAPDAAGPDEAAPEAAPPPEAIAGTDAGETAPEPAAGDNPDYKLVSVFYGTDRNAMSGAAALRPIYSSGWFMLTAVAAGVSLLLLVVGLWIARSRATVALMALGMMATCALAAVTVLDYLQAKASTAALARTYGNERGELELGTCQVSIPKRHEVGQVERPSLLRGEVYEDPRLHVVLLTVNLENEDQFYSGLRARVDRSKEKEAFVFVHGFNVTFEEAARRTAQLAYDLDFDGAPIFFSWPSQGGLLKYAVDETNVVWAVPHLKQFLHGVARQSGATSVHLIAHSMGNRALTSALESIASEMQGQPPMFREVLLTAPDIDADVFKRDIAPAIVHTADRVTLYASSNDEALKLSKGVHGYPRAGDSGPGLVIVPGIDTIDVSTVDTSLLGHSYYGSNHTVIADMLDLLHEAKPPDQRHWLQPQHLGQMLYWIFSPERLGVLPAPTERPVR